MAQYKEKPKFVDAIQFDGSVESAQAIIAWRGAGLLQTVQDGGVESIGLFLVPTVHGDRSPGTGDWFVMQSNGNVEKFSDATFNALYEIA